MSNLLYLLKQNKYLLILLGAGLLMLFITIIVALTTPGTETPSPSPLSSMTPLPSFQPAQIQEFTNQSSPERGTLVVNSSTQGVKVTIDQDEIQNPEFFAPENITPFFINTIPTGRHVLRASKLGFLNQMLNVQISTNQVTQVNIQMQPDPDFNALEETIKEMPFSNDDYYIEYLSSIQKIQVIVRKSPFETYKQQAINWFRQRGVDNPEESGVLFYPAVNINQ